MTKKDLIKALEPFDENMEVFLDERVSEFDYGLLNTVRVQKINFKEDPSGKTLTSYNCIVLSEE